MIDLLIFRPILTCSSIRISIFVCRQCIHVIANIHTTKHYLFFIWRRNFISKILTADHALGKRIFN